MSDTICRFNNDAIAPNSEQVESLDLMLSPLEEAVINLSDIVSSLNWNCPKCCIKQAGDAINQALFIANELNLIIREIVEESTYESND